LAHWAQFFGAHLGERVVGSWHGGPSGLGLVASWVVGRAVPGIGPSSALTVLASSAGFRAFSFRAVCFVAYSASSALSGLQLEGLVRLLHLGPSSPAAGFMRYRQPRSFGPQSFRHYPDLGPSWRLGLGLGPRLRVTAPRVSSGGFMCSVLSALWPHSAGFMASVFGTHRPSRALRALGLDIAGLVPLVPMSTRCVGLRRLVWEVRGRYSRCFGAHSLVRLGVRWFGCRGVWCNRDRAFGMFGPSSPAVLAEILESGCFGHFGIRALQTQAAVKGDTARFASSTRIQIGIRLLAFWSRRS
jgi:hypothetical protein